MYDKEPRVDGHTANGVAPSNETANGAAASHVAENHHAENHHAENHVTGSHVVRNLVDSYARKISYLRVSVTDRCDFRCLYCMPERMKFLSRAEVLSLEELDRLCSAFIALGVRKLRVTGGEPLVRQNIISLIEKLGRHLDSGKLDELTLTTNGSQLGRFATQLVNAGMKRVNVSMDTLNAETFAHLTRRGRLDQVLQSIDVAQNAGLSIKINTVVLKGVNDREIDDLIEFTHSRGMDLSLIETMPLGEVDGHRIDYYRSLTELREELAAKWTLVDDDYQTAGPARYVTVKETGGRIGFITPLSHNFCDACNRVRLTCEGVLYMCLGHDDQVDLKRTLRASDDDELLYAAIHRAIRLKPQRHNFAIRGEGDVSGLARHMSVTGG